MEADTVEAAGTSNFGRLHLSFLGLIFFLFPLFSHFSPTILCIFCRLVLADFDTSEDFMLLMINRQLLNTSCGLFSKLMYHFCSTDKESKFCK